MNNISGYWKSLKGQVIENAGKKVLEKGQGELRRTNSSWYNYRPNLNSCQDMFINLLYNCNLSTLLDLRRVSKTFYDASMNVMDSCISPLRSKVFVSVKTEEVTNMNRPKLEFLKQYANINYKFIEIAHLNGSKPLDNCLLGTNVNLSLKIEDNADLTMLTSLLSSDRLSDTQKQMITQIKELDLLNLDVDNQNIAEIKALLGHMAEKEVLSQVATLSLGDIHTAITLKDSSVKTLCFYNIHAVLTLKRLPNLKTLWLDQVHAIVTFQGVPNLAELSLGDLHAALMLQEMPNLTMLSFKKATALNSYIKLYLLKFQIRSKEWANNMSHAAPVLLSFIKILMLALDKLLKLLFAMC